MVKYAAQQPRCGLEEKCVKAKISDCRTHFKNTRETANAVKNMGLKKAKSYLQAVLEHKQCVPFRVHTGGVGRTSQAKNNKSKSEGGRASSQGRWPEKSVKVIMDLLRNAESNAELKGLDIDDLYVSHIAVQRARKMRRRTYRAHGRINPYMASPCHVELFLEERSAVNDADED